ncbi:MAG: NAD(P)-binding domain-containing protein [Candidatus Saccharimonadales bacterium]
MNTDTVVGILGAGKLGVTIAQLALAAGYTVYIAGSGDPVDIELSTKIITPGAVAVTAESAVKRADIVMLALPLGRFGDLGSELFHGKLVIDGMNHWREVDGPLEAIIADGTTTSEAVQRHLVGAHVIKALNHMGYHHLRDEAKPAGASGRKAIAVAGDDEPSVQRVNQFVNRLGFDPLYIGGLRDSHVLESGQPAFGANVPLIQLQKLIKK